MAGGILVQGRSWVTSLRKIPNAPIFYARQCGDFAPSALLATFGSYPVIRASTVVFDDCDKNFVSYWMREAVFPDARLIILNSHPCDSGIVSSLWTPTVFCPPWSSMLLGMGRVPSR